jgi:N-methylhydantoinase B/oxoprolinase/acetone carboxylase alpha subunit
LLAQVAANEMGAKLLKKLIEEYGVIEFKTYVRFICENAAESVRKLLYKFSVNNKLK